MLPPLSVLPAVTAPPLLWLTGGRAAVRILRYLVHTADKGVVYIIGQRPAAVSAYVDVAFANEAARRSRYGFAVFMAGCLISCLSKCTTMVCLSTSEAEFVVDTEAAKDVERFLG